jgi:hypothetical protein
MDNWKNNRLTQMMMKLQQQLVKTEEALENLQEFIQENQEARQPSISTAQAITLIDTTLVCSPSIDISHEELGEFENHTIGIGSKILRKMGYDGQGIGRRKQGILNPIIDMSWVKHEGLCFDGGDAKPMTMKTTFVRKKDMPEFPYSSEERASTHEGGNPLPSQPSCGRLKKGNNENILKT